MSDSTSNRFLRNNRVFPLALCLFLLSFSAASAAPEKKADAGRIHITADRLVSGGEGSFAEFIGNVKATQQETVITADRLKIHYASGNEGAGAAAGAINRSIRRIVASGKVTIQMDGRTAESAEAVYTTADRVLVLTGEGSRISSGENFITGTRIVLERDSGQLTVEGGGPKRVQAVIHSSDSGLE